jgi:peptidoglycan LD-endopeptidase LytH
VAVFVLLETSLVRRRPEPAPSALPPASGPAAPPPLTGPPATPPPGATIPAAPVLTVPAPSPGATAWPPPPDASPLGMPPSPSAIPGDSTDAHLDPRAFAAPADLGRAVPLVSDLDRLHDRHLAFPIEGFDMRALRDNFAEQRGGRVHEAIDVLSPRGTPVVAVDDGVVKKLFNSRPGGLTVYQFDPTETYCYYYAHLDRYAEGLTEGKVLRKGERVGYVGTSGNAPPGTPHLHFTIFKLGVPEKRWWEGTSINPFPLWALAR